MTILYKRLTERIGMSQYKIIFTGTEGAGKTTAIQSISDVPLIKTDTIPSDMVKAINTSTMVAMDYGMMNLEDGEQIHLYGIPGQARFDSMWDILKTGGTGLILLLNNSRADPFKDMRFFLNSFESFINETQVAIGVTKMDLKNQPTMAAYHDQFKGADLKPPIFEVDTRVKSDVILLLQALLFSLDPGVTE
jgi:uncharacterized protein